MDSDEPRKLDSAIPASIDHVALNNQIVGMRKTVKRTKVQLINRMVKRVRQLKNSRSSEMAVAKKQRKAERILQEIQVIKNLDPDKVSKYALANTSTVKDVANLPPSSETKAMARYANHKILQEAISKFRQKHTDWKALAAYLLTKNTGRRFKKKVTKEKTTFKAAATNKKAGESLMKTFLQQKMGGLKEVDVNESEGLLKEKNKQRTNIRITGKSNLPREYTNSEEIGNPAESLTLNEEESSEGSEYVLEKNRFIQSRAEMVVEPISLDGLDEGTLNFSQEKSKRSLLEKNNVCGVISSNDPTEDQIPLFLKLSDKNSKTVKVKKDSFFMCNDEDMDSGNEEKSIHNDNDDDDEVEDSLAQIQKGKLAMRSTFLGSLTDNKKEKVWAGKYPIVRQVREKGHSMKGHSGQQRNTTEHRGISKRFHHDLPYNPSKPVAKQTRRHSDHWNQNKYEKSQPLSKQYESSSRSSEDKKPALPDKEEKLHPSWQASKQRKKQASQIQAFQGKKTTFSDDD